MLSTVTEKIEIWACGSVTRPPTRFQTCTESDLNLEGLPKLIKKKNEEMFLAQKEKLQLRMKNNPVKCDQSKEISKWEMF